MKTTMGSDRRKPANQPSPAPETADNGGEKEKTGTKTPPTQERVSQSFTRRLAAIFAGQTTKPEDLMEPLLELCPAHHEPIGVLTDPVARELFSFSSHLSDEADRLPRPRNAGQVEAYKEKVIQLKVQSDTVNKLFWEFLKAAFPQADADRESAICAGWQVVLAPKEDPESGMDTLRKMLARSFLMSTAGMGERE